MADVVMPQMGESIAEGTIVRWIKKVGETVDRDEPLFEISTDKVDAEIPSPAAGVISEIRVQEGETVPVNSVVAVIGAAGAAKAEAAPAAQPATPAQTPPPQTPPAAAAQPAETPAPSPQADGSPDAAPGAVASGNVADTTTEVRLKPDTTGKDAKAETTPEDAIRQRSSPLVRKIAKEHNVDISQLHGTGIAGRVTKHDILDFVEGRVGQVGRVGQEGREGPEGQERKPAPATPSVGTGLQTGSAPRAAADRVEKMSPMRKRIAEHMVMSKHTSAHVHSVFEVNFSRVAQIRDAKKAEFERAGAKLTYLSFIIKAAVDALHAVPIVNASVDGESIVYHKDVNLGIAVALDWGLIVPVIKNADERNLLGLSRAVADLAGRARSKQLKPEEVAGGTFTITNPGVFGALFGTPVINQPQVAILGVGNIEKRAIVIDDAIAIRPMAYLTLGYDHRVIDGAVADEFMSIVKRSLENWDPNVV
jgi:pyruvate dehydrogenase E2 component (dihydrolipoamide acetyltransferase)